ncbi:MULTISPECIES: hypothetical protein [Halorussus]|uniref:hypothetical protein n=1 Tax=Halorussus TaxID=1070314 RepID=UPI001092D290|nr:MULTISPECIES: hypothetical protein [Halorussus]
MKKTRRGFVSVSVLTLVTGCLSEQSNSSETRETAIPDMSKQGQAPKVSVRKEIQKKDVEYIEGNNSVRYKSGYKKPTSNTQNKTRMVPTYDVIPFSQWAKAQCAELATSKINKLLHERIDEELSAISVGINHTSKEKEVYVDYSTTLNPEGEVIKEPSIPFEKVVEATPKVVISTIGLSGKEHKESYEIHVKTSSRKQQ